jgi:hypothetical protein
MVFRTFLYASVLHVFGKITKGSTCVDSVMVLNDVRNIQKNGTSIVSDCNNKNDMDDQ